MSLTDWDLLAFLPLLVTLVLAFVTRSALLALLAGVFAGVLMLGHSPGPGLNDLFQRSLGNADFIWICQIVMLIGILFELFRRADVLRELARRVANRAGTRRKVELTTWGMGFLIVDDYFSPLLTGAMMRPLSDRALIPREKLAFLLDSTTASVCILVPFTAWGAYMASLVAAQVESLPGAEAGLGVFIRSIPWNFYPMLMIVVALLVAAGLMPDFGPMRRAEQRVRDTGALLRPGARPLIADEPADDRPTGHQPSLRWELALPVVLLVGYGAWSLVATGSVQIVEAFLLANTLLIAVLWLRGGIADIADTAGLIVKGASSVTAALLVVALAYALNSVTSELGVAEVVVERFAGHLTPGSVVALTFLLSALISFSTGTSWGTFALMMPVALPLALEYSGGELAPLVYQTIAAVAGGGIFGDHASPVSDTSVLSSVGAGSDHIDHVITQLPYALLVATATVAIYILL